MNGKKLVLTMISALGAFTLLTVWVGDSMGFSLAIKGWRMGGVKVGVLFLAVVVLMFLNKMDEKKVYKFSYNWFSKHLLYNL